MRRQLDLPEPTEQGAQVLARYMGQGNLELWTLTGGVWVSGSTRTTWASLTDQRIPKQ